MSITKAKTKNQRLLDCFDAYARRVGGRPCTTNEVSEWMLAQGLWPVATMRDSAETVAAWEKRFAEVKASTTEGDA